MHVFASQARQAFYLEDPQNLKGKTTVYISIKDILSNMPEAVMDDGDA